MEQKIDYNKLMKQQIEGFNGVKPNLLLHSCCAPCSSSVIQKISPFFNVTVVYYNPNIWPKEEYLKRKAEQIKLLKILNINLLDTEYNELDFMENIKGLENEKEGGARCNKCFLIRLKKVADLALKNGFDYFGTTLTVSPHKNAEVINKIGKSLEQTVNVNFLFSDFKKENGYLNSINLSKEYNLYRQDYCGCLFSKKNEE